MNDLISILMPVKNAAPFLKECIDSILAQIYTQWELLAINDHSSDQSKSILEQYAASDPRISVVDNEGSGIIDALRLAYKKSKGSLITRMDADDRMPTIKLKRLSDALKTHGKGHLATGLVRYFSDAPLGNGYLRYADWLNDLTTTSSNYIDMYKECVIPSPCWMVHRDDLDQCNAFKPDWYPEDYDLCFRFYEAGLTIIGINEVLHEWRDHSTRASRTDEHYADNLFLDLKVHYFLKLECKRNEQVILVGAGKKGKQFAKRLQEHNKSFLWYSNNVNKIGQEIYDVEIQNQERIVLNSLARIIVAVTGPDDKIKLEETFNELGLERGVHYWWMG